MLISKYRIPDNMDCPNIEEYVASQQRVEDQSTGKAATESNHAKSPGAEESNANAQVLAQPWKKIIDDITTSNEAKPLDKDFFVCKDGFYSHSLTA